MTIFDRTPLKHPLRMTCGEGGYTHTRGALIFSPEATCNAMQLVPTQRGIHCDIASVAPQNLGSATCGRVHSDSVRARPASQPGAGRAPAANEIQIARRGDVQFDAANGRIPTIPADVHKSLFFAATGENAGPTLGRAWSKNRAIRTPPSRGDHQMSPEPSATQNAAGVTGVAAMTIGAERLPRGRSTIAIEAAAEAAGWVGAPSVKRTSPIADRGSHAIPSNLPVLSPKRSTGAPTRSSIEQKRLLSGVWSGALTCRPGVTVPPPRPASKIGRSTCV